MRVALVVMLLTPTIAADTGGATDGVTHCAACHYLTGALSTWHCDVRCNVLPPSGHTYGKVF